jgi:hypothetical protein
MERQLWTAIVALLTPLDKTPCPTRHDFRDAHILTIYLWAVIHDRPIAWACSRKNWPIHLRSQKLPSPATMSRRLRHPSVEALFDALADRVIAPKTPGAFWIIDGKPLPIGGASGDRDGRCGRAANGMARGYKLHAVLNSQGEIAASEVTAMNVDERTVAARLIEQMHVQGYLVADANYDSNKLHALCDRLGNLQLITPRRYAKSAKSTGHRPQTNGRQRCLDLWNQPKPKYIDTLLEKRDAIERCYGNLTNWGGGLGPLPAWVRTLPRVTRWVRAKLIINAIKRQRKITTYDAGSN